MAHVLTHYTHTSLDDLRKNIDIFVSYTGNMKWIEKFSSDILKAINLDAEEYVSQITQGLCGFDELAIVIACAAHNIHCMVLLQNSYWTTHCKNDYTNCLVKLVYVGGGVYKEIKPVLTTSQSFEDSDEEEDLHGTGLLSDQNDETDDNKF